MDGDSFDPFIVGSDHRRNQEMLRKATSLGEDFALLDWLIAEPREVTMRNLHMIEKDDRNYIISFFNMMI